MEVDAEDGRIYLPKETREKHGTKFELIDRGDRIILFPIPEDPLKALREEVGRIDKSVDEIMEDAGKTMMNQAGN